MNKFVQFVNDFKHLLQMVFDDMFQKNIIYSEGEDLFGLPKTEEPQLNRIKKELQLLQVQTFFVIQAVSDNYFFYFSE